jgi:hypothetical protein
MITHTMALIILTLVMTMATAMDSADTPTCLSLLKA